MCAARLNLVQDHRSLHSRSHTVRHPLRGTEERSDRRPDRPDRMRHSASAPASTKAGEIADATKVRRAGVSPVSRRPDNPIQYARTAEECGRSAARTPPARSGVARNACGHRRFAASPKQPSGSPSTGRILESQPLTIPSAHAYIGRLGAPPPRDGASCEAPHCLRGESSGHELWPCRMCGLRRLRLLPGTGP